MKPKRSHREPGQVIVLAALIMVAVVGLLALVADTGLLWEAQRELQQAADSAALAGVVKLPDSPDTAVTVATQYAQANSGAASLLCHLGGGADPTTEVTPGQTSYGDGGDGTIYTLTVSQQCTAGFTFGRVLGLTYVPNKDQCDGPNGCLRAHATAAVGSLSKSNCVAPFGVSAADSDLAVGNFGYDFGQIVQLHVDNSDASYGNFHAIDLGNGAKTYEQTLSTPCQGGSDVVVGHSVWTETGDMVGPTRKGLVDRGFVSCDASNPVCTNATYRLPGFNYDLACPSAPHFVDGAVTNLAPCMATIPIVGQDAWQDAQGHSQMNVVGFGEFYMLGYDSSNPDKGAVLGMFVRGSQTSGDLGAYDNFGTIVTRLIR
jgi:hypothetical protein